MTLTTDYRQLDERAGLVIVVAALASSVLIAMASAVGGGRPMAGPSGYGLAGDPTINRVPVALQKLAPPAWQSAPSVAFDAHNIRVTHAIKRSVAVRRG
jgi:hypothetical protein